nr:GAF domain-containing sensor histidine kinase [Variovorax boronicumulans]
MDLGWSAPIEFLCRQNAIDRGIGPQSVPGPDRQRSLGAALAHDVFPPIAMPTMTPALDAALEKDLEDIASLEMVGSLLSVVCHVTGMGFSAVARVTDDKWLALAVRDEIAFGLLPGQELDVHSTLCKEVRAAGSPVVIDDASRDLAYAGHHTPRIYNIKSYISVPIVLSNGEYFGNLCAIDPRPAKVSQPQVVQLFHLLSQLIASQLENIRRRQTAELAFDAEQANSKMREQFIAVMGHDLRNPLMSITAGAALLKRVAGDEVRVVATADRIEKSARRMKLLIDDVQDLSRGRLGAGLGLQLEWVDDIGELLEPVIEELRDANTAGLIQAAMDVTHPVRLDRARVQQLLSNLIANALVHGEQGAPVLVLVSERDASLLIQVRNQGNPISPELLASVFGAFTQGERRQSKHGLGLGLFICEQVAKAHGGSVTVTSSAEQGTVFTAKLPLRGPASG